MDAGLSGRVALVTGGSQGIGLAVATGLHRAGADIVLLARHEDQLDIAAQTFSQDEGRAVLTVTGDVADAESVRETVVKAHAWQDRLDIVVNAAGPTFVPHPIAETPETVLLESLNTKLLGAYRVSVAALPLLPTDGTGRIINIGGTTGRTVVPNDGVVSGVTNAAVIAFTGYLALEAGRSNVLANTLSPGMVYTDSWIQKLKAMGEKQGKDPDELKAAMAKSFGVDLGRWASTEEIGKAAVFLASDLSSYVSGRVLDVDGGLYKAVG